MTVLFSSRLSLHLSFQSRRLNVVGQYLLVNITKSTFIFLRFLPSFLLSFGIGGLSRRIAIFRLKEDWEAKKRRFHERSMTIGVSPMEWQIPLTPTRYVHFFSFFLSDFVILVFLTDRCNRGVIFAWMPEICMLIRSPIFFCWLW